MSASTSTILVTGGTSGLGYQCALEIARKRPDCHVVVASRSDSENAASTINEKLHQGNVEFLAIDLSNLANVRAFASTWASKKYSPISSLIMNAGLQFPGDVVYTDNGIEKTFAINHIGHALLFYLLCPYLASKARIIITSSGTHDPAQNTGLPDATYTTAEELAHPTVESAKNQGRQRYATSKLCNVMWGYALHRHLTKTNQTGKFWSVNSFDPGLMPGTGLARDTGFLLEFIWNNILPNVIPLLRRVLSPNVHTAQESGEALARLAIGDDIEGVSGKYFEGMKEIKSSTESYDVEKQDDLWNWTAKFVAKDQQELEIFENF